MICGLVIFHNGYLIVISLLLGYAARQWYNAVQGRDEDKLVQ